MTREIKFRAWDKEKKLMHKFNLSNAGDIFGLIHDGKTLRVMDLVFGSEPKKMQIMQYTGLKDKNGKEIYEGDIIDCNYGEPKIVEYSCMYGFFGNFPEGLQEEMFEVIGNIYENNDLLQ